jgi:solute:Na+ symporter, SSS family
MGTHGTIIVGLIVYAALMVAVSFFWMLRVRKAADYLLAGRGLPFWALTGTTVGSCIGTGVVIGASGLAYKHGWAGCAYPIGLGIGTVLIGLLFGRMRRYNFMTLGEEIACYYHGHRGVIAFSNVSLFISQLCWLTVQIMGGAAMLGVLTGMPPPIAMVISGIITAVVSVPGGLKTVVYTDCVQASIFLLGFSYLAYVAVSDAGGLAGLRAAVPAANFSFLGVESYGSWQVASLILTLILGVIADPGRRVTMYSATSERAARWSLVTGGMVVLGFAFIVGVVGMYTFKLNPSLPSADQAIPWLVMNVLPPSLAAIVVVSVASAIFSAANGNAAAVGSFFVRHIYPLVTGRYPAQPVVVVRRALACAFVGSTLLAFYTGSIVGFVVQFLPITMSGLAVIILMARFWKRANWQGALTALIVTPAVSLTIRFTGIEGGIWTPPIIPATIAGIMAHLIVSILTPAGSSTFDATVKLMALEREHIEGKESGLAPPTSMKDNHEEQRTPLLQDKET